MSDENVPPVRLPSAAAGSEPARTNGPGGGAAPAWFAEVERQQQMAREAAERARVEAEFQASVRASVPPAFASNETWLSLRRVRDASDRRIQPDECWRIRQPSGRF